MEQNNCLNCKHQEKHGSSFPCSECSSKVGSDSYISKWEPKELAQKEQKSCKDCGNNRPIYWDACSDCNGWEKWVPVSLTQKELEERIAFGMNGTTAYDVVSKPKHYMLFEEDEIKDRAFGGQGIEVRDVIKKLLDKMEDSKSFDYSYQFAADYVQLMQYLMRFMDKNGKEDLRKGSYFLDKLIKSY